MSSSSPIASSPKNKSRCGLFLGQLNKGWLENHEQKVNLFLFKGECNLQRKPPKTLSENISSLTSQGPPTSLAQGCRSSPDWNPATNTFSPLEFSLKILLPSQVADKPAQLTSSRSSRLEIPGYTTCKQTRDAFCATLRFPTLRTSLRYEGSSSLHSPASSLFLSLAYVGGR